MKRRAALLVVAVLVPLAVVAIVLVARHDGGSRHTPARLPIVAARRSAQGSAANVDAGPLAPYGQIVYKAGPDLPPLTGTARAYRVTSPDLTAATQRLADAFGLHGEPADNGDGGFVVNDGAAQLVVTTRSWSYTRDQSGSISSGVAAACAPDAPACTPDTAPTPTRPADLPSQDDAKAAALAVLGKVGVDTKGAAVTVEDGVTQWFVTVAPVIDGIATEGFGSSVIVGAHAVVDAASGMLGTVTAEDEYPVIGTSAGIDRLNAGYSVGPPVPETEIPVPTDANAVASATAASGASGSAAPGSVAPGEPVEPPAAPIPPSPESSEPPVTDDTFPPPTTQEITLTSAERILLYVASADDQEGWLVPSYRFTTADGPGPSVIAVEDQFLTPPDAIQPAVKSANTPAPAVATDQGR